MLFVDNENQNDASINLAIEEYLIRNIALEDEILLFYINGPSIIIGRNQNTVEEINVDHVRANDIKVVRRLSGGGAVYHDLGNLNFSFIAPNSTDNFHNFRKFTQPVIDVLQAMGVPAELSGRNDIVVAGRKISGNAQYVSGPRMVSHGTLLWNTKLNVVAESLRVKQAKIESKGIKSVRSRVANITEFLPDPAMDILDFRQKIIESVFAGEKLRQYQLTAADWEAIHALSAQRYQSWDWNYGRSPAFNLRREMRYGGGGIEALLEVEKGMLKGVKFYGDFFGQRDVAELEEKLIGCCYEPEALRACLADVEIGHYFVNLSLDDLIGLLY
jgi:lipoate-protein ligase A